METTIKRNSEIELTIEKLVQGGMGLGRINDFVIMVSGGAIPGQRVKVRIVRKKKNHAKAQILEILEKSPHEIAPVCPHFGPCGGCKWLTMPYEQQLSCKQTIVEEALKLSHDKQPFPIHEILPSPKTLEYRNKLEYSFGKENFPSDEFHLGFHKQGRLFDIVDIEHCHFTTLETSSIVRNIHALCRASGLSVHSTSSHTGFFRYLIVRRSEHEHNLLLNLVHYPFVDDHERKLFGELKLRLKEFALREPSIRGLVLSISNSRADIAKGETYETLYGDNFIVDHIDNLSFKISPYSFFQTNTLGAELLYNEVRKAVGPGNAETILDLYAGTGTIGMYLSTFAKRVYALELNPDAIADMKVNAELNTIKNIHPVQGKTEIELPKLLETIEKVDCVVVDPPRSGMHPEALATLIKLQAPRIVYVSCNPATLNRDLLELMDHQYTVAYVQPVDMFPQTHHTENVAVLDCLPE